MLTSCIVTSSCPRNIWSCVPQTLSLLALLAVGCSQPATTTGNADNKPAAETESSDVGTPKKPADEYLTADPSMDPSAMDATGSTSKPSDSPSSASATRLTEAGAELKKDDKGNVIEANFRNLSIDDTYAEDLGKLVELKKLTINKSNMTDAGWKLLGQFNRLEQLDLRDCPVSNEQLGMVLAGTPNLRALRLNGKSGATTVDDQGLAALENCPELKALALDHLWVGEAGLASIAGSEKLVELYMAGTLVEDEAMRAIGEFANLRKLRLAQTSISAAGLGAIESLPIEDIDLSECSQLTDAAMKSVGKLTKLKRLNLWRDSITDDGVADLSGLTGLQWLNLDNTQLRDAGLRHLRGMKNLTFLHLGSTGVSDEGMTAILPLKSLKDLKVTRTSVTEAGVQIVTDGIDGVNVQLQYVEGE